MHTVPCWAMAHLTCYHCRITCWLSLRIEELLLHSVIAGATMQWAVDPDGELADHVLAQIAAILCLMFPEHDDFQLLQAHA